MLATLLSLAAAGFVLAPIVRRAAAAGTGDSGDAEDYATGPEGPLEHSRRRRPGRDGTLRALYRDRLRELDEESAAGILDESSRPEVEQELSQGLLDEFSGDGADAAIDQAFPPGVPVGHPVAKDEAGTDAGRRRPTGAAGPAGARSPGVRGWLLLAVAIPALALSLYAQVGEPDAALLGDAPAVLQLDPEQHGTEIHRWRIWFESRLEHRPDDAQTRYLLGRVHLMEGRYRQAADAFARAHASTGDDPAVDVAWLQAIYLADQGRLDEQGRRIAARLLERDPNQPMVLEMLAIDAYRRGDYRDAVGRFSRSLSGAVDPMQRAALEVFLRQARAMLGDLVPRIDVELGAAEAPPASASLFVIARPVGGGMPYAVVRRAALPLPERVRLDDAVSMNPNLLLSAATEIEVIARISLTGAAMPHPGDWEWRSEPLSMVGLESMTLVAELAAPGTPD